MIRRNLTRIEIKLEDIQEFEKKKKLSHSPGLVSSSTPVVGSSGAENGEDSAQPAAASSPRPPMPNLSRRARIGYQP